MTIRTHLTIPAPPTHKQHQSMVIIHQLSQQRLLLPTIFALSAKFHTYLAIKPRPHKPNHPPAIIGASSKKCICIYNNIVVAVANESFYSTFFASAFFVRFQCVIIIIISLFNSSHTGTCSSLKVSFKIFSRFRGMV